jgi:NADP-dependent 3-hydroxy acid dehydrogenase YdfG
MTKRGIENKVVVITGASSGLGEAAARRLAENGAKLVLGARRIERLRTLAGELGLGQETVVQTDVTDRGQVKHLVDHAVATYGRIDVLLNNAGLMPNSRLERLKVEDWDQMIDVNIKGVLYGIAAALPHMQAQKSGHIINVASVAGHKVGPGGVATPPPNTPSAPCRKACDRRSRPITSALRSFRLARWRPNLPTRSQTRM